MVESRSNKRIERYRELRALGFSTEDARRYRDRSASSIDQLIASERRRISRKSHARRSSDEEFRLTRIQERQQTQTVQRRARIESRLDRWRNFSEWSKRFGPGFPEDAIELIARFNRMAGLNPFDSFGYRMYYYMYVERMPEFTAQEFAERGGSDIRYLTGEPNVRGRVNLRHRENPPKEMAS